MIIKGTVQELELIINWGRLCEIIGVDYYKRSWINENEVFTIYYDHQRNEYTKIYSEEDNKKVLAGYQQRFIDDDEGPTPWSFCYDEEAKIYMRKPNFQVRPVYAFNYLD